MSAERIDGSRAATLALAALLAVAAIIPPETDGTSLAGIAGLALLAALLAFRVPTLPAAAAVLGPAALLAALRARFADAPGEAVVPVALPVFAAAAGLLAAAISRSGERRAAILRTTAIVAGAIVGARAVYEALFGLRAFAADLRADPSAVPEAARVLGRLAQGRAYAGFPTPASAACFLAIVLPLTVAWALARHGRDRALLLFAAALQLAGIVATRSITAAVALFAALILAAVASRSRRLAVAAASLASVIALFAALRAGQVLSSATDDDPGALRAGNFRIAAAIARDHPWMGVGPGGYGEAFPRYRRTGDNESRHAHMTPLEWSAEWGVPVGGLLSVLFLAVFLGPLLRRPGADGAVDRGVAIGLAALALHNLTDFTALLPSVLTVGCVLRGTIQPAAGAGHAPSRAARLIFAAATLGAAAVLAAAGLSHAALDAARTAALHRDTAEAAAAARRAARWAPWSADAALFSAQAGQGLDEAGRAVSLVPQRASAREVRAGARLGLGDTPGAYADLVVAADANPMKLAYGEMRERLAAGLPRAADPARTP